MGKTMSETKRVSVFPLVVAENFSTLPYLSLGMVTAYLREWNAGLLNRSYKINRLMLGGVEEYPIENILSLLEHEDRPVCLLSSYVWNHKINIATIKSIKTINPGAVIIVGGPEIPKYQDETELFLDENPYVDFAVLGEGEVTCAEILHALCNANPLEHLSQVNGIVYRAAGSGQRAAGTIFAPKHGIE